MLSEKQHKIICYLRQHNNINLDTAVELIGYGIYCNEKKYVGAILARMVKQNHLVRIKPGVFELPNSGNVKLNNNDLFGTYRYNNLLG